MSLTRSPLSKILEALLSYINVAMSHQQRQLIDITALFQIDTGKSMTERVSRNVNTSDPTAIFNIIQQLIYTSRTAFTSKAMLISLQMN